MPVIPDLTFTFILQYVCRNHAEDNVENFSDSLDLSDDKCIGDSFSREIQDIEQLEQRDYNNEDGINAE
jgi:hypothetical protein